MDSAVLLDLLGNENRRRILRLLSQKPCYVTEISEYIDVSPKAVIDHLRKLEEAGLIESRTDDQRRKYFHITRSLRLEVDVSPHSFGAKSAYPASSTLDMSGRCPHLSLEETAKNGHDDGDSDHTEGDRGDIEELAAEFGRLQSLDRELSLAQRWVHGRLTETLEELTSRTGIDADCWFYAKILAAIVETDGSTEAVADQLTASSDVIEDSLSRLERADVIEYDGNCWQIGSLDA
jgi:ArsR family transcriptional regulator